MVCNATGHGFIITLTHFLTDRTSTTANMQTKINKNWVFSWVYVVYLHSAVSSHHFGSVFVYFQDKSSFFPFIFYFTSISYMLKMLTRYELTSMILILK